jgi:hypothetical protein
MSQHRKSEMISTASDPQQVVGIGKLGTFTKPWSRIDSQLCSGASFSSTRDIMNKQRREAED